MNKAIKKNTLILLIIIFLPIGYLIYKELNSISEYEENLNRVYKAQLETILFSVNQHSEDILGNWNKVISSVAKPNSDFLNSNKTLLVTGIYDESVKSLRLVHNSSKLSSKEILEILRTEERTTRKLISLKKNGYQKFEPLKFDVQQNLNLILFALDNSELGVFVIDKQKFVEEKLVPKLESIKNDAISLLIFDNQTGREVFPNKDNRLANYEFSKQLWLFPELSLGIKMTGKNITQIINEKLRSNIIFLAVIIIVVMFLAYYIFQNIKNEMLLIKMKSDFVANISHELRTPLSLISLYAETLSLGRIKNEDKRNEYYRIISQESERLSSLVNKILGFAKIEEGKMKYDFEPNDLSEIVQKVYDSYKYNFESRGFACGLNLSEIRLECNVDVQSISEAIINLIDNAIKYSQERKEILIQTGRINDFAFIEVVDKGIGISSKEKEKIFEKFYRVTKGNLHEVKGTGIGLTIVEQIVKAHNGKIQVESELGSGSKFQLLFPLIETEKIDE